MISQRYFPVNSTKAYFILGTKLAWNRATVLAPRAAYWQNRQYAALGAKSL